MIYSRFDKSLLRYMLIRVTQIEDQDIGKLKEKYFDYKRILQN